MLTLLTGGARSGKSRQALELAEGASRRFFIATAEPLDDEMSRRIDNHKIERGDSFETREEPIDLAAALATIPDDAEVVILDCLTLWLNNLMFRVDDASGEFPQNVSDNPGAYPQIRELLAFLDQPLPWHLIVVTNEVGLGIVPGDPLSRAFRDLAGWVNQEVATRAQRVLFMVSGCAMVAKASS